MKVVVDDKIPFIKEIITDLAEEVVFLPGASITADEVKDADALIIRTRTRCDKVLLENSKVRFIATATIGFDHIDTEYCREKGIVWKNCPGCNAGSVAQYICSALLALQEEKSICLENLCLGIVGVGHVGSLIYKVGKSFGMKVLCCDPPRANRGDVGFVSLEELAKECHIISFHTPLVHEGPYRTYHLADDSFFQSLKKQPIIMNTSRGEVVETEALLAALNNGRISEAVIDVWENEPRINLELLKQAFIGTPHIAGYSADGKANATRMALEAFCEFFQIGQKIFDIHVPSVQIDSSKFHTPKELQLALYDPRKDSIKLKKQPEKFETFRSNYPLRREKIE